MTVTLPDTVVYANAPSTISTVDGSWENIYDSYPAYVLDIIRIQMAAQNLTLNGQAVWAAVNTCDNEATMQQVFMGLSGQTAALTASQLKLHCSIQAYSAVHGLYAAQNGGTAYYIGNNNAGASAGFYGSAENDGSLRIPQGTIPANGVDFFGSPMMPIAAIGYWLYGGGLDRYVHIESLNLQLVVSDFKPITDVLNDPATVAGAYVINQPFSYNTFSKSPINLPAAGTFGRISGNVEGTLVVNADGTYNFYGQYTLNDDVYDADASNRSMWQEALTTFLHALGDTFGHTDYTIKIIGAQAITFSGSK